MFNNPSVNAPSLPYCATHASIEPEGASMTVLAGTAFEQRSKPKAFRVVRRDRLVVITPSERGGRLLARSGPALIRVASAQHRR